ncbi:MAG: ABC transporter permease [Propionibacteriaceae bacterium]|nr:ABC transporter permease [Propionibacteriaceae bacterium]
MTVKPWDEGMRAPGHSRGIVDIPKWWYLLDLLVKKELRVRYRGSILGMMWTYVKPVVQLTVFYFAAGKFMKMSDGMDNYVIYLFSGIIMINLFNEILMNVTTSIVANAALVGKIYLPRELFPVSSVWVALVHFFPQVVVLLVGAVVTGWRPGPLNIVAIMGGVLVVALSALGLGLAFAAWNVMFRDSQNFVELISMVVFWMSPVIYKWSMVNEAIPRWLWYVYMANPVTIAVELFHYGFWVPTTGPLTSAHGEMWTMMPNHWVYWSGIGLVVSLVLVAFGQAVFRKHEAVFAQELG